MRVYRIEGPTGMGAFTYIHQLKGTPANVHDLKVPGDLQRSSYDGPSAWKEYHEYGNDTIMNAQRSHPWDALRFCCVSLDQMREWFFNAEGCQAMGDNNCTLMTYEVPDDALFVGVKQAVFLRSKATIVNRQHPKELHPCP